MSKFILLSVFLLSIFLLSCQQENQNSEKIASNYELQIVDSVRIDLLSSGLNIVDVNDVTGNILGIQSDPPVAYILSPKGEILKIMDREPNDPQAVGEYLLSGEFYEDGIALMGMMRVKTYDNEFNLRRSTKPHYNQSGMIYMGHNHLFEIKVEEHNRLITYFGPQTELRFQVPEYYEEFNVVDVLDPYLVAEGMITTENTEGLVYKPIGSLPEDSRYKLSGRAFYFMKPVIDVKKDRLFYAFKDDTTLYELALPSGELMRKTTIPFDNFILFKGYIMGRAGFAEQSKPRDWQGSIDYLFRVNDFDIVIYRSGVKLADIQAMDEESSDFRQKVDNVNYTKHLIIKNGKRMNNELRLPEKISYIDLADNNGFLWAHQDISNLEEEPQFITFYKLKVVEVR
uniref:hypothetical protein n=1 Tax=Roseivirga sp. TaxID=1964215 RepID=UPI0040480B00